MQPWRDPLANFENAANQKSNQLQNQLEQWLGDLRTLSCGAREKGEPRELVLIRRELAERDDRIRRLEQSLQQRSEVRDIMVQEHEKLKEQLDAGLLGGRLLQIDAYGKMDRRAG